MGVSPLRPPRQEALCQCPRHMPAHGPFQLRYTNINESDALSVQTADAVPLSQLSFVRPPTAAPTPSPTPTPTVAAAPATATSSAAAAATPTPLFPSPPPPPPVPHSPSAPAPSPLGAHSVLTTPAAVLPDPAWCSSRAAAPFTRHRLPLSCELEMAREHEIALTMRLQRMIQMDKEREMEEQMRAQRERETAQRRILRQQQVVITPRPIRLHREENPVPDTTDVIQSTFILGAVFILIAFLKWMFSK
ncbi:hypothetical protein Pelo_8177 [Pelomyxa schiedti]|nr:hypothetical protein Pelo_8177 [Pelomyxa schiedti]